MICEITTLVSLPVVHVWDVTRKIDSWGKNKLVGVVRRNCRRILRGASSRRKDRLLQLSKLEEHRLMAIQHQEVQKQQQKAWHDRNIKNKNLLVGDLALLYNSWVKCKRKEIHTEWMGPYIVEEIHTNGSVRLRMLQGIVFWKLVNGARLKRYRN